MVRLTRERIGALLVMGIGIVLVAVVPEYLGARASDDLLLGLSVVGAAFAWAGALWDDTICRRHRDERVAEIHYRAGYNTALAYAAILGTLIFVTTNLDWTVGPLAITGSLVAGLAVYFGTVVWLKRRM